MAEGLGTPEGIDRHHIEEAHGGRLHSLPIGLLGLGVLIALSIFGFLGAESSVEGEAQGAALRVDAPQRIRNGEFFEMTFTIDAREEIENLVVTVDEAVWQDVTVNTFFPAAEAESFANGAFEFEFGPVDAGRTFVVKVDCQVNPDHGPSANAGPIGISDGDEPITEVDYTLEVLP